MTRFRYIVKEDIYAVREPRGIFGAWTIKKGDLEQTTDYASYVSFDRAKKLSRDLRQMAGEDPEEADVIDLLDEIHDEPSYSQLGGIVVYFIPKEANADPGGVRGATRYYFQYIGKVGRIKVAHQ